MRLGDLDALKEHIVKLCRQINASNGITVPTLAFTRVIDNAPTVEPENLIKPIAEIKCEITEEEKQRLIELLRKEKPKLVKLEPERPQGEWIDYDNTFYKCPECGYLLEKCCPQCQNKVILPKGGAE